MSGKVYYHRLLNNSNNMKCTLCNKNDALIRLPEEFQVYSRKKNFESFFCGNCVQIINFVHSVQ